MWLIHPPLKKLICTRKNVSGKIIFLFKTLSNTKTKIFLSHSSGRICPGSARFWWHRIDLFLHLFAKRRGRPTILLGNFDMVDHTFSIALAWVSLCIPLYSIIYRGIIVSNSRSLNWPSFNVIIKWKTTGLFFVWKLCKSRNPIALVSCNKSKFGAFYVYFNRWALIK